MIFAKDVPSSISMYGSHEPPSGWICTHYVRAMNVHDAQCRQAPDIFLDLVVEVWASSRACVRLLAKNSKQLKV